MASDGVERFKIQSTLLTARDEALHVVRDSAKPGKLFLRQTLHFDNSAAAEEALESRKTWQNAITLNFHPAFLTVVEMERKENIIEIIFEGPEGKHLPQYVEEYFKGYAAEEGFALELTWHLVEMVRSLLSSSAKGISMGKIRAEDIFITGGGRVKVLPSFMESIDKKFPEQMLEGFAELLFTMLTREKPEKEKLIESRIVNKEISEAAEQIIRRCALTEKDGGFGNILSLRQALHKELKPEERPLKEGFLRDFKSDKTVVDYDENLEQAVDQELGFLERMRHFDLGRDCRFILHILRDANRQLNWNRLWPFIVFPYFLLLLPLISVMVLPGEELNIMTLILIIVVTLPLYTLTVILIYHGYRRPRR